MEGLAAMTPNAGPCLWTQPAGGHFGDYPADCWAAVDLAAFWAGLQRDPEPPRELRPAWLADVCWRLLTDRLVGDTAPDWIPPLRIWTGRDALAPALATIPALAPLTSPGRAATPWEDDVDS
jgi:hypothetical protein